MLGVICGEALLAKEQGLNEIAIENGRTLSAVFTNVRPAHIGSVLDGKSSGGRCPQL